MAECSQGSSRGKTSIADLLGDDELAKGPRSKKETVPQEAAEQPPAGVVTDDVPPVVLSLGVEDAADLPAPPVEVDTGLFDDVPDTLDSQGLELCLEVRVDENLGVPFPNEVKRASPSPLNHSDSAPTGRL